MPICWPGVIVVFPNARPRFAVVLGAKLGGVCARVGIDEERRRERVATRDALVVGNIMD